MEIASKPAVQNYRDKVMHSVIVFRDGDVPASLDDLPFDYMDIKAAVKDSQTVCTTGSYNKAEYLPYRGFCKGSYQVQSGELASNAFVGKYVLPFNVENTMNRGSTWGSNVRWAQVQSLCTYLPIQGSSIPNKVYLPNSTDWTECVLKEPAIVTAFSVCSTNTQAVNYMDVELLNMEGEWVRPTGESSNMTNGNMRMYGSTSDFGDGWRTVESYYTNNKGHATYNNNIKFPAMIRGMRFRGRTSSGYLNSVIMYSDDEPSEVSHSAQITHALVLPYYSSDVSYINIQSPLLMSVGGAGSDLVISNQGFDPVLSSPDIDYAGLGLNIGHI